MSRIQIEHVTKTFIGPHREQIRALDDFSLVVEEGELVVLVGPSGCGKTTALRAIAGLEKPSAGTIALDGRSMDGVAPKDRDIAMVFQNPALYPHMSVRDNLAFGLKLRKCPRAEQERRVREAIEILGLGECLERRPGELSGGQCQRVALGRALVRKPKVLLFDEPLSNLDPSMRSQLRLEISRLHRQIAATVLYVTHDQMEAMTLGNRVAVMRAGSLQQIDRPMALYQHPATTFVAEFIGSPPMNLIPGTIDRANGGHWFQQSVSPNKSEADALRLLLPAQLGDRLQGHIGKIILGLRPEQIAPADASAALPSRQTAQLVVELIEPTGPDTFFHARCGGRTVVGRAHGSFSPRLGQELSVAIDLTRLHLFDGTSGQTILCGS